MKCRDSSFEIRNLLGKGRNSVVFRALAADGLEVAVKAREDGTDAEGQLSREAEVLTALDASEGFPRIVCATESFIVMELLSGFQSLDRFENPERVPQSFPAIAIQLIRRLERVHAAGFVHVDLHKRNIMLTEDRVALIDFGLATRINEHKNPQYVNLFLSSGFEQAHQPLHPLDDIERLMYVLLHVGFGPLPWAAMMRMREAMNEENQTKDIAAVALLLEQRILQLKLEFPADNAFFDRASNPIPAGFRETLNYVATMRPMRESASFVIDYDLLRSLFRPAASTLLPVDAAVVETTRPMDQPSLLPIRTDHNL